MKRKPHNQFWTMKRCLEDICPKKYRRLLFLLALNAGTLSRP